jgi:biotin synthase
MKSQSLTGEQAKEHSPSENDYQESPDYVRLSLAGDMTLGYREGLFYRNARMKCINLLLTYREGCHANCAYCGLARFRTGTWEEKSFIHVAWPIRLLSDIVTRIESNRHIVKRVCISMLTNRKCIEDTREVTRRIRASSNVPVALLISPSIVRSKDLQDFKSCGADKIGIAIDLATETLFSRYRGRNVRGPHRWERYWECFRDALDIFGERHVGAHFMVGMGETEKEMITAIQKIRNLGGVSHLFSFFPEKGSAMASHPQPPMGQYRRIQLGRYLIDEGISRAVDMMFGENDRIVDFGISSRTMEQLLSSCDAFETSGCLDGEGKEVACNRPFGNSLPGIETQRNYPFHPNEEEKEMIRSQLWT